MTVPPTITRETVLRTADHEILLSFNNDEDAIVFFEWWNRAGEKLFMKELGESNEFRN